MPDVQVVFATDDAYFLLAKGLVLSIEQTQALSPGFELALVDLGCTPAQLQWFGERGIRVVPFDEDLIGPLAQLAPPSHRALILRPHLPMMFPAAGAIVWIDSDIWLQSGEALYLFGKMALGHPAKLFICPEWHYSYLELNLNFDAYRRKYGDVYYRSLYGEEMAQLMGGRPTLNAGIFSMAISNPLWELWRQEVNRLYLRPRIEGEDCNVQRLAEQTSLNVLAYRNDAAIQVDPLYNYSCMWALPFRDATGIVRVPLPPNPAVSVVHLLLWKHRREGYMKHGLLFDSGNYLTEEEKVALLS